MLASWQFSPKTVDFSANHVWSQVYSNHVWLQEGIFKPCFQQEGNHETTGVFTSYTWDWNQQSNVGNGTSTMKERVLMGFLGKSSIGGFFIAIFDYRRIWGFVSGSACPLSTGFIAPSCLGFIIISCLTNFIKWTALRGFPNKSWTLDISLSYWT